MSTPELPPLTASELWVHEDPMTGEMRESAASYTKYSVEARERILQARIAELEAVLAKFDERWLMDGELGFCTACGVSIEGGESHKPECWLAEARAAIDAARKA